jgi:16S rRNA (cytosine1402-N4)-methyltransferase
VTYHVPVLADEVVNSLVTTRSGAYLDATSGGGGHCKAILGALAPEGWLYAVDRDNEAVSQTAAATADSDRISTFRGRFSDLAQLARENKWSQLDGIFFDLGMSSHQIDTARRGFSYRADGPLDMRMNGGSGRTAAELIESTSEAELATIIKEFGEERGARRIARSIGAQRREKPVMTTADLRQAVEATFPKMPTKSIARVFQAIRIWVNDELRELEFGLKASTQLLATRGRVAVIAYHSLEDRLVKSFFEPLVKGCVCPPRLPVCACGRNPEFSKILKCRPEADEIQRNQRARSAIMRVFERL